MGCHEILKLKNQVFKASILDLIYYIIYYITDQKLHFLLLLILYIRVGLLKDLLEGVGLYEQLLLLALLAVHLLLDTRFHQFLAFAVLVKEQACGVDDLDHVLLQVLEEALRGLPDVIDLQLVPLLLAEPLLLKVLYPLGVGLVEFEEDDEGLQVLVKVVCP